MKKNKNGFKNIILIVIIIGAFIFLVGKKEKSKLEVKSWNNVYNENNINMYYGDAVNTKIKALNDVYRVKEIVKEEEKEIDEVLKVVDIVNNIVEFDDVGNSKNINGFDILEEKAGLKKVSQRDMGIITRDLLLTIGIKARVGEFNKIKNKFSEGESYYVVEYWSNEYEKWIMIDFMDRGYIEKEGVPSSAIEVITSLDKTSKYSGKKDSKKYLKDFEKKLDTYTVAIDNSTTMEKSNSYITYVKDTKYIDLKLNDKHIPPTVFTENVDLFNRKLANNKIGVDEKAYIILMKKETNQEGGQVKSEQYIVGGFKDGKISDMYYIRENSGEFKVVNKYLELKLINGINKIELSLDGKNVISSIEIDYNE